MKRNDNSLNFNFLAYLSASEDFNYIIIGRNKINLKNLDELLTNPDNVIEELSEDEVFHSIKNIYLNTPD